MNNTDNSFYIVSRYDNGAGFIGNGGRFLFHSSDGTGEEYDGNGGNPSLYEENIGLRFSSPSTSNAVGYYYQNDIDTNPYRIRGSEEITLDTPFMYSIFRDPASAQVYVDSELKGNDNSYSGTPIPPTFARIGGHQDTDAFDRFFDGSIAEMVIYNSESTVGQRNQIESYLAIKYGMTLNAGNTAYVHSGGTPVWSVEADYKNNIVGIGRDDNAILNQKVSKSIYNDAILNIALDKNFTDPNNAATRATAHANDRQFMLFANNGATGEQQNELASASGFNLRLSKEWKLQKTANFTQNISLKFEGYDDTWTIISTSDGDFSNGVSVVGTLDADGEFTTTTPLVDGLVLTLAKLEQGPGGLSANLALWLKADAGLLPATPGTVTAWLDQSSSELNISTINGNPQTVPLSINFNPSVDFDAAGDFLLTAAEDLGDDLSYFLILE